LSANAWFVTPDAVCSETGQRLNDIWRYFRHTWVNIYRSVPGRNLMILVRDRAVPGHPVIGIAALASSVIQQFRGPDRGANDYGVPALQEALELCRKQLLKLVAANCCIALSEYGCTRNRF
jgi:hypothetical protein